MHLSPAIHPVTGALAPNHDEIAQCAREIWTTSGQPEGRDVDIWLDAERRLISAGRAPLEGAVIPPSPTRQQNIPARPSKSRSATITPPAARTLP